MELTASMIEAHIYRKRKGKIEFLLLKRGKKEIYPGLWQMVTGKIKKDEKAFKTVLREVKEETDLTVKKLFVVPNVNSFYSFTNDSINFIPVFLCLVNEGDKVKISKEHCKYRWVSKEIIYSFLTNENKEIHKAYPPAPSRREGEFYSLPFGKG